MFYIFTRRPLPKPPTRLTSKGRLAFNIFFEIILTNIFWDLLFKQVQIVKNMVDTTCVNPMEYWSSGLDLGLSEMAKTMRLNRIRIIGQLNEVNR